MYKEKLDWWWFLLLAAVLVPIVSHTLFKTQPYYIYQTHYIKTSLNPSFVYVANFLFMFILCIHFKLIKKQPVYYLVSGIAILILINIGFFIKNETYIANGIPRKYYNNSDIVNNSLDWKLLFSNLLISILLIFFIIKNLPDKKVAK